MGIGRLRIVKPNLRTQSVSDGLASQFRKRQRQPVAYALGSQINAFALMIKYTYEHGNHVPAV